MVGIAALLSVPFGILAAVFLAEFDPEEQNGRDRALLRQNLDWPAVDPGGGGLCLCHRGIADRDIRPAGDRAGAADAASRHADR